MRVEFYLPEWWQQAVLWGCAATGVIGYAAVGAILVGLAERLNGHRMDPALRFFSGLFWLLLLAAACLFGLFYGAFWAAVTPLRWLADSVSCESDEERLERKARGR